MNYSSAVIRYFDETDHAGTLSAQTDGVYVQQLGVSDRESFELSVQIDGGVIQVARFRAFGPPVLIAAGEWVCRQVEGQSTDVLLGLVEQAIIEALDVTNIHIHLAALVCSTVKAVCQKIT